MNMKKITLFGYFAVLLCLNVIGQSGTFSQSFTFNEVNGNPTKFEARIDLYAKSPDLANSAKVSFFTGDPSAAFVQNEIFDNLTEWYTYYGKYDVGNFYVTQKSETPLSFTMNYGYSNMDGDERIVFDKVTYTTGRYKETETPEQTLSRSDQSYDCNFVQQNCRVYQAHSFSIKRDKVFTSPNAYDNVSFVTLRYYMSGKIAYTVIFPYTVKGKSVEYLSTGLGPYELLNIIRAVPGDQSKAFMIKTASTISEVTMGVQKSDSKTESLSATVSAGFSAFGVGGSAEVSASQSVTNTAVEGKENTYTQKFIAQTTHENDNSIGVTSDLFIVAIRKYDFGMEYDIKAKNESNVTYITSDMKMLFYPLEVKVVRAYSEFDLIDRIIPAFEKDNMPGKANYWKMLVHKNDSIKKAIKSTSSYTTLNVPTTGAYTYTTEYSKSSSLTLSQEISIDSTESISVKAEVSAFGSSASAEGGTSWTVTTTSSSSNTNGQGDKVKTGYSILDNNDKVNDGRGGDILELRLWKDPTTGTAIWALDEAKSATSCPYEGGYQLDQPEITVQDPNDQTQVKSAKYSEIAAGDTRMFLLTVANNSNIARAYDFKIPNSSMKPTVSFSVSIEEAFILAAGESTTIELTVESGRSTPYAYKNFKVIFGPLCDPSVCDTVLLSAFYGDTDDERPPENDFVVDAFEIPTNGSLVNTYINNYGNTKPLSTSFATVSQGEAALVPPRNCYSGWCEEKNGTPEITNSVWFKFVVATPEMKISTCMSFDIYGDAPLNSQMSVFRATDVNDFNTFTRIASNDDDGSCENVKASFIELANLTVGDTLYIMVDGFQGQQADFGIFIYSPRPANDDYCGLQVKPDGIVGHYSNYRSWNQENEQLLIPESTDPVTGWKEDEIQHSVHFWFIIPPNGDVNIELTNANFDSQISVYEKSACNNFEYIPQWKLVAANDDPTSAGGGLDSRIELRGRKKNTMYRILVDGYKGAEGIFDLTLTVAPPENDEACNAIVLDMDEYEQGEYCNLGATASDEEQILAPDYAAYGSSDTWSDQAGNQYARQIERSAWFKFVAPPGGGVELSTCDMSSFNLQLALYKVGNCSDFSTYELIKAEDNSKFCWLPQSSQYPNGHNERGSIITIEDLEPDSTYYVLVDGGINTSGFFSFNLTALPSDPPANDDPCNAINIPANGEIQKGYNNLGSTKTSSGEDVLIPDNWEDETIDNTVWFTFVAPSSGEAEISTCDMTNFDSQIAVYKVTNCADFNSYTLIGANEEGPKNCATNGDNFLPLTGLIPGITYYVVVDANGSRNGNFDIVIRDKVTLGPENDDVTKAILLPVNGVIQKGFDNLYATVMPLEQNIRPKYNSQGEDCVTGWCDNQVDNSVWFKFVAPASGNVSVSTCDLADFNTQLALFETTDENDFTKYTLVAANDAGPAECETYFDSYLPATGLTPEKTYYIMVDGSNADNGGFDIVLSENVDLSNATVVNSKNELNVYPNPFNKIVNLEFSRSTKISSIQVYDVTGVRVFETSTSNSLNSRTSQVDLSSVSSGILLLMITTEEGTVYKKMMKY
jgi:hypothetical protein